MSFLEALPVIVLYQSFSVNISWITLWTAWWIVPILLLFHVWFICDQFIKRLKIETLTDENGNQRWHCADMNQLSPAEMVKQLPPVEQLYSVHSCQIHIVANLLFHFSLFLATIILAIRFEGQQTGLNMIFIICLCASTFIATVSMILQFLHIMTTKYCAKKFGGSFKIRETGVQKHSFAPLENAEMKQDTIDVTPMHGLFGSNDDEYKFADGTGTSKNRLPYGGLVDDYANDEFEYDEDGGVENDYYNHDGNGSESGSSGVSFGAVDKEKCGWIVWVFIFWLLEIEERRKPGAFGERIYGRRFFLVVGTICYSYIILKTFFNRILKESVKDEFIHFLNSLHISVTWPDNENGGTLLDNTFNAYGDARMVSYAFMLVAIGGFILALLFDLLKRTRSGLQISRYMAWSSVIFLFIAIFSTAIPNYLKSTPINDVCPYCAPGFNNAVFMIFGDIIGILCSGMFTISMLPILIAITPSLVRASYLVLHDSKIYKLSRCEKETLCMVFKIASILTGLLTFLPLLVYQQTLGDHVVAAILLVFWIVPMLIGLKMTAKRAGWYYLAYMCVYLGCLLAILVYHWIEYGLPKYIREIFLTADTYVEIIAEIFLANVILGDFLFTVLMVSR